MTTTATAPEAVVLCRHCSSCAASRRTIDRTGQPAQPLRRTTGHGTRFIVQDRIEHPGGYLDDQPGLYLNRGKGAAGTLFDSFNANLSPK